MIDDDIQLISEINSNFVLFWESISFSDSLHSQEESTTKQKKKEREKKDENETSKDTFAFCIFIAK